MNTLEILKAGRKLITNEENFCQGSTARNTIGESVSFISAEACSWCSYGAILSCGAVYSMEFKTPQDYLTITMNNSSIGEFNDNHTHAEVLAKWDEAIALAEKDSK